MPETPTAVRCPACGTELAAEGAACPACAAAPGAAPEEAAESSSPLWARLAGALLYVVVGAACAKGAYDFFKVDNWIFGTMGVGLVAIALVGVKESLFPSEWKPE